MSQKDTSHKESSKNAAELIELKEKLLRVRAVLCPLKLKFAVTLADFGLVKEAMSYALECRAVIVEVCVMCVLCVYECVCLRYVYV